MVLEWEVTKDEHQVKYEHENASTIIIIILL